MRLAEDEGSVTVKVNRGLSGMVTVFRDARPRGACAALLVALALPPLASAQDNNLQPAAQRGSAYRPPARPAVAIPVVKSAPPSQEGSSSRRALTVVDHLLRFTWRLIREPLSVLTVLLIAAALLQFELSRRTARRQLRAYLVVHEPGFIRQNNKGLKFEARPVIQNVGQTPAYKVWGSSKFDAMTIAEASNTHFRTTKPKTAISSSTVGPQKTKFLSAVFDRICSAEEIKSIQSPLITDKKFFVWGSVWYTDVFGKEHRTNYCFHSILPTDPKSDLIWYTWPYNNDAD